MPCAREEQRQPALAGRSNRQRPILDRCTSRVAQRLPASSRAAAASNPAPAQLSSVSARSFSLACSTTGWPPRAACAERHSPMRTATRMPSGAAGAPAGGAAHLRLGGGAEARVHAAQVIGLQARAVRGGRAAAAKRPLTQMLLLPRARCARRRLRIMPEARFQCHGLRSSVPHARLGPLLARRRSSARGATGARRGARPSRFFVNADGGDASAGDPDLFLRPRDGGCQFLQPDNLCGVHGALRRRRQAADVPAPSRWSSWPRPTASGWQCASASASRRRRRAEASRWLSRRARCARSTTRASWCG